ncbi:unnamed protein product [Rangifer tarandus platyrhynchus]|uniref:Uncharacterized protein n=2 Tax=Rangifer tarandus platyrhynchus TaxID=3082113 RepID=A0ABN8YXG5_RANTA|nr:unnamed protein product [Rangifer tarandus platyrhynchus]CAI9703084.1 unnamed protein product [Rangifer tarandus platyrhynchus]
MPAPTPTRAAPRPGSCRAGGPEPHHMATPAAFILQSPVGLAPGNLASSLIKGEPCHPPPAWCTEVSGWTERGERALGKACERLRFFPAKRLTAHPARCTRTLEPPRPRRPSLPFTPGPGGPSARDPTSRSASALSTAPAAATGARAAGAPAPPALTAAGRRQASGRRDPDARAGAAGPTPPRSSASAPRVGPAPAET